MRLKKMQLAVDAGLISKYRVPIMGIAAIMIMLFHTTSVSDFARLGFVGKLVSHGNTGVDIFLFLSGVGLYYSFSQDPDIKGFYWRRFINVLPISFLLIGLYIVVRSAIGIESLTKGITISLSYGSQNPAWYVVLILTLYIAYPFIHKSGLCVGDSKRLLICLLLIIILCYGWASLDLESYRLFESSLTRLPVFLLGCRFGSKVKRKDNSCLLLFSVVGILLFKLLQKVLPVEISGVSSRFMGSCLGLSICFLSAIVLEWIAQTASGRKAAIALGFFGKMSLETYLTHNLTKTIFYDLGMLSLNVYLIIVLCSIVISIPLSRLRNKLYYAYRDSAPVNHAH